MGHWAAKFGNKEGLTSGPPLCIGCKPLTHDVTCAINANVKQRHTICVLSMYCVHRCTFFLLHQWDTFVWHPKWHFLLICGRAQQKNKKIKNKQNKQNKTKQNQKAWGRTALPSQQSKLSYQSEILLLGNKHKVWSLLQCAVVLAT